MDHVYRIIVRGKLDRPDEQAKARLRAREQPDLLRTASFSEEGTLSFPPSLAAFTFRIEVAADGDDPERAALEHAELAAMEALDELDVPYRDVKSSAMRMDDIKVRRKS